MVMALIFDVAVRSWIACILSRAGLQVPGTMVLQHFFLRLIYVVVHGISPTK